jgi:hypothetical protein
MQINPGGTLSIGPATPSSSYKLDVDASAGPAAQNGFRSQAADGGIGVVAIGGKGTGSSTNGGFGIIAFGGAGSPNGGYGIDATGGSNGSGTTALAGYFHGDVQVDGCMSVFGVTPIGRCLSDARLKKNIQPFSPVLDKVVQLQPVSYTWRVEEFPQYHFDDARNSGLIAQEVEKVFPDMVSVDEAGFKRVNYSELPYLMLQAIRDLKAENDHLREQLKAGEERFRRIEGVLSIGKP